MTRNPTTIYSFQRIPWRIPRLCQERCSVPTRPTPYSFFNKSMKNGRKSSRRILWLAHTLDSAYHGRRIPWLAHTLVAAYHGRRIHTLAGAYPGLRIPCPAHILAGAHPNAYRDRIVGRRSVFFLPAHTLAHTQFAMRRFLSAKWSFRP